MLKDVSGQFCHEEASPHTRSASSRVRRMRKSVRREFQAEATSACAHRRKALPGWFRVGDQVPSGIFEKCCCFAVHVRGLWKALLTGLQLAHSRSNSHWRPTLRLSVRRLQQEVCSVDQPQVAHPHSREAEVSCAIVESLSKFQTCLHSEQYFFCV